MLNVEINNARVLTKREIQELYQRLHKTPLYSSGLHSSLSFSLLVSPESGLHKHK